MSPAPKVGDNKRKDGNKQSIHEDVVAVPDVAILPSQNLADVVCIPDQTVVQDVALRYHLIHSFFIFVKVYSKNISEEEKIGPAPFDVLNLSNSWPRRECGDNDGRET